MVWADSSWFERIWADLSWFELIWANLSWFSWFQLVSADCSWFQLFSADISWFQLISADFSWYQLISADFSWFQLISAVFSCFQLFPADAKPALTAFLFQNLKPKIRKIWNKNLNLANLRFQILKQKPGPQKKVKKQRPQEVFTCGPGFWLQNLKPQIRNTQIFGFRFWSKNSVWAGFKAQLRPPPPSSAQLSSNQLKSAQISSNQLKLAQISSN